MGVAEVLAGMGDELPGTVKFIFQPAEEGTPDGSVGGAELMLMEGAFENPRPDVVFGLHVFRFPEGSIATRPGGRMESSDGHQSTSKGQKTHGAVKIGRAHVGTPGTSKHLVCRGLLEKKKK